MTLQMHPLVFGVMLVVAVGTFAYTYWNSRSQRNNYISYGSRQKSTKYYPSYDLHNSSSTRSSVPKDEPGPSEKKMENSNECIICLGSMKSNLKKLTCSHIFHKNCITKWLVKNNTCPLCREVPL